MVEASDDVGILKLVEEAARAPSSHNTQPWLFRVSRERVELYGDRTRALPVNDPYDRELTISCGAALFNLEAVAAESGYGTDTKLLPNPQDTDHFATVTLDSARTPHPEHARLAKHIGIRRTTRDPFEERAIRAGLSDDLTELALRHDAKLVIIDNASDREKIAALVADGDRAQFADPRWRRELASWMHPRRKGDGLTMPEIVAPVSRLVVTAFDLGKSTAGKDQSLVTDAPLLVVLVSDSDSDEAWLKTGRALEAILLHATESGLQAGYLNQPCQVAELRPRLQQVIGVHGFPQIVLRLGHATRQNRLSPRRPVEQILLH